MQLEWAKVGVISKLKKKANGPTEKRPLGRPRRKWQDDNIIDLKEIGISKRNWVDLIQDMDYCRALVNAALLLRVP